ncbi:MAG: HDIG domain-containing metalloprotein [Bacteroidales bacterium]
MSESQILWKPTRKYLLNLIYFVLSTIIVVFIWPHNSKEGWIRILGIFILVSSCYLVLWLFLAHFRSEVLNVTRKTLFIILIILSFVLLTRVVIKFADQEVLFLIPFVIIPVVIRTFYDARLALFILLITIMLSGFMVPDPFVFIFMSFISGMVAIFTLTNIYRRAKLFITSLTVIISYSVLYLALSLMHNGNFEKVKLSEFCLLAGIGLLILISYPIISVFEKKFLFLSDATLLELADINQPLLRKLAEEAPGSFQHSLQVANLAEEAARITGGNLLLVRTGALYHDIGKIAYPNYYIENQTDGISLHDNLDPEESVKVIINHVRNGVILAKNFKLPVQIIDFIRTHHGTTIAYFFFKKYTDLHPWDLSKEKEFTYPGPKPFSKETAVIMMADAVEASSRSLVKFTEESINELVERMVYLQEQAGQFSDVPLTFKDISDIKSAFKKRLSNIYHTRIAYPERKF